MRRFLLPLVAMVAGASAEAQGCAQCKTGVEQSTARTQAAYRHGIEALTLAGTVVCAAGYLIIRRFR